MIMEKTLEKGLSKERIMSRIQKAMNLAKDESNSNEAQNAMLMAQRLMTKYDIEMSEVSSQTKKEEKKEMVDESITNRGRTPAWKASLAMVIGDNFKCYTYKNKGNGSSSIYFLGMKNDVVLAKEMFDFATIILEKTVKKYLYQEKKIRGDKFYSTGLRNDYILGFISGLRDKFAEQVEELCLTPMLAKDKELVSEFHSRGFSKGVSSSIKRSHDKNAYQSGHKEGKSLNKHTDIG